MQPHDMIVFSKDGFFFIFKLPVKSTVDLSFSNNYFLILKLGSFNLPISLKNYSCDILNIPTAQLPYLLTLSFLYYCYPKCFLRK